MAVWSEPKLSNVLRSFGRIDAEFFRPESLDAYSKVTASHHEPLGRLVASGFRVVYENTKILSQDQIANTSARFLQATNIAKDGLSIDLESVGYVTEKDWIRYPKGRIKSGEILIEVKGQAKKVTVVPDDFPGRTLVSGSLFKIAAIPERINPWYLFLFLTSRYGELLRDRLKTNTLIGFVSKPQLYSIPVLVPDLELEKELSTTARESFRLMARGHDLYIEAQQLLESELGLDALIFKKPVGYTAQFSEVSSSLRADPEYFNPVAAALIERITGFDHVRLGASFSVGNGFPWQSKRFLDDNSGEPVVRIRNIRPSHIDIDDLTSIEPNYAERVGFSKARKGDLVVGMDGLKYFFTSILEGDCYVNQRVARFSPESACQSFP